MKKQKYVIVSPRADYGGVIVLHTLCHFLNELGANAKVLYVNELKYEKDRTLRSSVKCIAYNIKISIKRVLELVLGPDKLKGYFNIPFKKIRRKLTPFVGKNTIVVYPDIIYGNPLNAKKVVRWLLYYNTLYSRKDGKTYGYNKEDLFFAYREIFNDKILNPECRLCTAPYFDLDLYKRTNFGERSGKCYIIRKGNSRSDLPKEFDGIIIDNLSEKEKVKIFNECEYCISYDTQTAYSAIAAICGCISVVVPEEGKTRKDYLEKDEMGYGRAYGFSNDEIEYAISTKNDVMKHYMYLNDQSFESIKYFEKECSNYFNK